MVVHQFSKLQTSPSPLKTIRSEHISRKKPHFPDDESKKASTKKASPISCIPLKDLQQHCLAPEASKEEIKIKLESETRAMPEAEPLSVITLMCIPLNIKQHQTQASESSA